MKWHAHSFSVICPTGVFYGLAFAADKKSSRKIKYKKIPRVHYELKRGNFHCPFLIILTSII